MIYNKCFQRWGEKLIENRYRICPTVEGYEGVERITGNCLLETLVGDAIAVTEPVWNENTTSFPEGLEQDGELAGGGDSVDIIIPVDEK